MAKQRQASNPAKIKAKSAALTGPVQTAAPQPSIPRKAFWLTPVLAMASAAMLIFSFAPCNLWPLAYVALVPWTLALLVSPKRWWAILWCFLAGVAFFSISLYWVAYADVVGYIALQPYLWVYFLVAAVVLGGLRGVLRQGVPVWIALPVVWVALEFARAYIMSGFPWFLLGHTQYQQTRLIQIADVTSDYGVSFFVAMVNGAIVDVLRCTLLRRGDETPYERRCVIVPVLAVVVVLAGLLGYGSWRLGQASECTRPGPVVALVQQAFPIALDRQTDTEEVYSSHLRTTGAELGGKGCQLVIWPETMLPTWLNPEILQADFAKMKSDELRCIAQKMRYRDAWDESISAETIRATLAERVRGKPRRVGDENLPSLLTQAIRVGDLSRQLGCPILAGGGGVVLNPRAVGKGDLWVASNLSMWFDGGPIAKEQYAKMHLVPFGEYVPFKYSWRGLHDMLRWFVPPVMEQLEPGTRIARFTLSVPSGHPVTTAGGAPVVQQTTEYHIATPICYEGVFARVCRDLVWQDGQKQADILANMSNDGWFTKDDHGTTEQSQHLSLYVFRAIENRVPVVRAVNTGISASIDSSGRIVALIQPVMSAGTLLLDGRMQNDTECLPGHGPVVLVDSRRSLYDSVGDLFAAVVAVAAAGMVAWVRWKHRKMVRVA